MNTETRARGVHSSRPGGYTHNDAPASPGPKRVVDDFRAFCVGRDLTLWQGLELLLSQQKDREAQE